MKIFEGSIGDLYKVIEDGAVVRFDNEKIHISNGYLWSISGISGGHHRIFAALKNKKLTIEPHWTERLDGTVDSGVWCRCLDTKRNIPRITRIVSIDGIYYKDEINSFWTDAKPLSQELQDMLSKELKND